VVRDEERNQHEREVRQERWDAKVDPHAHPLRQDAKHHGQTAGTAARLDQVSAVGQNSLCASTINAPNQNLICQASLTSSILLLSSTTVLTPTSTTTTILTVHGCQPPCTCD
jgi:hypothetical protein